MKQYFDDQIQPLVDELDEAMSESQHYDFLRLSRLESIKHHDPYECPDERCILCEALGNIINGQDDINHAYHEKNREYGEDLLGSAPF